MMSLTNTISLSHFRLQVATIGQFRFENMHQDVFLRNLVDTILDKYTKSEKKNKAWSAN